MEPPSLCTDEELDYKVFDIYGLTDEERRIIIEGYIKIENEQKSFAFIG